MARKRVQFDDALPLPGPSASNATACDLCERRIFRNETEAINCERTRVQEQLNLQFQLIEQTLAGFQLVQVSLQDLEYMQIQLMNELDDLRIDDPDKDDVCETEEYMALEKKYLALLDALDCYSQREHLENILAGKTDKVNQHYKNMEMEKRAVKNKGPKYTCFSFMFKNSRSG